MSGSESSVPGTPPCTTVLDDLKSINTSSRDPAPCLTITVPAELKLHLLVRACYGNLPICLLCHSGVLPQSLMDHFRKQHADEFPAHLRTPLRSLLKTLPAISETALLPRSHYSTPLPELHIVKAFQCTVCKMYIRKDVTDVRKHVNQEHSVGAAGAYEEVKAQSWLGGRRAHYWRVDGEIGTDWEDGVCIFGLLGKGWGDKLPKVWPKEVVEEGSQVGGRNLDF